MNYRLLALSLLLLPACSSKDEGSTQVDPLSTPDGFCEQWAQAICSAATATACGTTADVCKPREKTSCLSALPNYTDVNKGLVVSKSKACIAAVGAAFSDQKLTAAEYDVFKNFAGACSGLDSTNLDAGNNAVNIIAAGSMCTAADTCAAGSYCNTALATAYCVERPGAGAGCCIDATCNPVTPCKEDSLCKPDATTGTSVCVAKAGELGACTLDEDCAADLICSGPTNGVCVSSIALGPSDPRCVAMRS